MTFVAPKVSLTVSQGTGLVFTLFGVRVAYAQGLNAPRAMEPKAGEKPGEPRYDCTVFVPENEVAVLNQIKELMWKATQQKFGQKAEAVWMEMSAGNKLALRSGATKASTEGFLGNFFISPGAKQDRPPKLFHKYLNPNGSGVLELTRPQNVIYSGCYVNVQIGFWAQDNSFGKRINAELLAVQFAADGEAFSSAATADVSVFGGVAAPQPEGFGAPETVAAPSQAPVAGAGYTGGAPSVPPGSAAPAGFGGNTGSVPTASVPHTAPPVTVGAGWATAPGQGFVL